MAKNGSGGDGGDRKKNANARKTPTGKAYESLYFWYDQVKPYGVPSFEDMPGRDEPNEMLRAEREKESREKEEKKKTDTEKNLNELKEWEQKQPGILKKEFQKLYDGVQDDFFSKGGHKKIELPVKITRKEAQRQAEILMQTAIDIIAKKREYHIKKFGFNPEPGSYFSNLKNEKGKKKINYQCNQWADEINYALHSVIDKFGAKNAFKIIRKRRYSEIPVAGDYINKVWEHNWVEIESPSGERIVIDPWPSGGQNVIPQKRRYGDDIEVFPDIKARTKNIVDYWESKNRKRRKK